MPFLQIENYSNIKNIRYIKESWAETDVVIKDFWKNAEVGRKNWKDPADWKEGDVVRSLPGYNGGGDWLIGRSNVYTQHMN